MSKCMIHTLEGEQFDEPCQREAAALGLWMRQYGTDLVSTPVCAEHAKGFRFTEPLPAGESLGGEQK